MVITISVLAVGAAAGTAMLISVMDAYRQIERDSESTLIVESCLMQIENELKAARPSSVNVSASPKGLGFQRAIYFGRMQQAGNGQISDPGIKSLPEQANGARIVFDGLNEAFPISSMNQNNGRLNAPGLNGRVPKRYMIVDADIQIMLNDGVLTLSRTGYSDNAETISGVLCDHITEFALTPLRSGLQVRIIRSAPGQPPEESARVIPVSWGNE